MNILRRFFIGLLASLLSAVLFGLAWTGVGLSTIHNRQTVKSWAQNSGVYTSGIDAVLESAQRSQSSKPGEIPLNDPAVQSIARQAFSPAVLQKNITNVIDGSYNWLDGTDNKLTFTVDLTQPKQQLAQGLNDVVTKRTAALPVCEPGQIPTSFDVFNASCRPAQLPAAEAGQQARNAILTSDFIKDPIITADSFKVKGNNGETRTLEQTDVMRQAKTVYNRSTLLPALLIGIAAIAALCIVLLSDTRAGGIRRVGYLLVSGGLVLMVTYLVLKIVVTGASNKLMAANSSTPQGNKIITKFALLVTADVKKALLRYIVIYIALGLLCFILTFAALRRQKKARKTADAAAMNNNDPDKTVLPAPVITDTTAEQPKAVKHTDEHLQPEGSEKP